MAECPNHHSMCDCAYAHVRALEGALRQALNGCHTCGTRPAPHGCALVNAVEAALRGEKP